MTLNPIGIAVPFFFLLLGLEVWVAARRRRELHRLNDSIADLTCGMGDQLIGLFAKGVLLSVYVLAYSAVHGAPALLPGTSLAGWVFAFLAVDFCYYCYHRFSHRVNIGWATHVVHHQSEEFNLAVALRQPWFSQFYSWIFYIPLALVGVHPLVYVTCFSFNLIYQFWIHTELVRRLGPLEWVLNTPSHHRVHHGINEAYLDRNYAGVFIVWDRLLGTFTAEEEAVLYGTRKPLRSWNPWTANVQPIVELFRRSRRAPTAREARTVWVAPPEWRGREEEELPSGVLPSGRGYDLDTKPRLKGYVLGQLVVVGVLMTLLLTFEQHLPLAALLFGAALVFWTGIGWAGFFEGRSWARPLEWSRLTFLLVAGLLASVQSPEAQLVGFSLFAVGFSSFVAFWRCRGDLVRLA